MSSWTAPLPWMRRKHTDQSPAPPLTVSWPFSSLLYLRLSDVSPLTHSRSGPVWSPSTGCRASSLPRSLRPASSRLLPYTPGPRSPASPPPLSILQRHSGWIKLLLTKFLLDIHLTRPPIFLQEENFHKLRIGKASHFGHYSLSIRLSECLLYVIKLSFLFFQVYLPY